jgi:hypothetical protein
MARKAKQVANWGEIDPKVFAEFEKRVEALRDEMIPRDYDNDSPIKVVIVNKMKYELAAVPVPRNEVYSYEKHGYLQFRPDKQREMDNETERWLGYNLESATGALEQYFRMRNLDFQRDKDKAEQAARPIDKRIADACTLCADNVGFLPKKPRRDGSESRGVSYMHDNGTENGIYCRAYELRMIKAGIKTSASDEPNWCPTCKAELGERLVSKGVRGVSKSVYETVCINPECPKSKAKKVKVKPTRKRLPPYKGNIEGGRRAIRKAVKAVVNARKATA